jgi:hypothetical protein
METTLMIKDIHTTIEVENGDTPIGDKTITFKDWTSSIVLELSSANYEDLGNKLFPKGLMPDTFTDKLDMLQNLIEDIGPVFDNNDKDWCIDKVTYNEEEDKVYFSTEDYVWRGKNE